MSRIYDRVLGSTAFPEEVKDVLKKSVIFVGDNVADYYYNGTDQEYWDEKHFPNVSPPAENFFVDFRAPRTIVSEDYGTLDWGHERPKAWGIHNLVLDLEANAPEQFRGWYRFFRGFDDLSELLERSQVPVRWVVDSCLFFEMPREKPEIGWAWRWFVAPNGKIADPQQTGKGLIAINTFMLFRNVDMPPEVELMLAKSVLPLLHCEWLFLSFFHTKNTSLIPVTPPAPLVRKSIKKRGYHLHGYRVLEIEPLKRVLETEGRAKEVGLQRALHICRGHFRDYRKHGLFGKHKGIYWFDSHVRGGSRRRGKNGSV